MKIYLSLFCQCLNKWCFCQYLLSHLSNDHSHKVLEPIFHTTNSPNLVFLFISQRYIYVSLIFQQNCFLPVCAESPIKLHFAQEGGQQVFTTLRFFFYFCLFGIAKCLHRNHHDFHLNNHH